MKTIYITLFMLFSFVCNTLAQQRPIPRNVNTEKEKARYEARVEDEKQAYLTEFIETLKVDDFQKEIIHQTMDSYFDEVTKINKLGLKPYERNEHIERLDAVHFKDLETMVNEDTMSKIMDALKGKWNRKDAKKKKKKKKKRKNKS